MKNNIKRLFSFLLVISVAFAFVVPFSFSSVASSNFNLPFPDPSHYDAAVVLQSYNPSTKHIYFRMFVFEFDTAFDSDYSSIAVTYDSSANKVSFDLALAGSASGNVTVQVSRFLCHWDYISTSGTNIYQFSHTSTLINYGSKPKLSSGHTFSGDTDFWGLTCYGRCYLTNTGNIQTVGGDYSFSASFDHSDLYEILGWFKKLYNLNDEEFKQLEDLLTSNNSKLSDLITLTGTFKEEVSDNMGAMWILLYTIDLNVKNINSLVSDILKLLQGSEQSTPETTVNSQVGEYNQVEQEVGQAQWDTLNSMTLPSINNFNPNGKSEVAYSMSFVSKLISFFSGNSLSSEYGSIVASNSMNKIAGIIGIVLSFGLVGLILNISTRRKD